MYQLTVDGFFSIACAIFVADVQPDLTSSSILSLSTALSPPGRT
jgi:hypothetical protein